MPMLELCNKCKNEKCHCRVCKGIHNACVPSFDEGWHDYMENGCYFDPENDSCTGFK